MKKSQILAVTIACVTLLTASIAESQPLDLYTQGKEAYESGDCDLAIELLSRYKAENEIELKKHPDFLNKLNDAINDCKRWLQQDDGRREIRAIKPRDDRS